LLPAFGNTTTTRAVVVPSLFNPTTTTFSPSLIVADGVAPAPPAAAFLP
jgi:hypothetical protein